MSTIDKVTKIRIIKRKQREILANGTEALIGQLKTESQSRREIVRTVASWIAERKEAREQAGTV